MLYDFIFLFILCGITYSYVTSRNQFNATASAFRQIWSGSCRLSCRHSGQSGFSGLSGLPGPPRVLEQSPSKSTSVPSSQIEGRSNFPGPIHDCNCESCPCALIENVLRTFRPATNIYSELIQCLFKCMAYFMRMLEDAYEHVTRVLECNTLCQRQAQITSTNEYLGSNANFNFGKGDKEKSQTKLDQDVPMKNGTSESTHQGVSGDKQSSLIKVKLNKPQSKIMEEGEVDTKNAATEPTKQGNVPNSSEESMAEKGFCSKCIEKDRTCIKECPRAAKK